MTPAKFSLDFFAAMISKRFLFGLVLALALLSSTSGRAQIGNDNPTGVSGFYNGNVTTGGSWDPYTGNATRSVTDLVVAGGVGYPLAFTRTMNTRYTPGAGTLEFGQSGTWRHNYQWNIDSFSFQSNAPDKWSAMPLVYTVNYPDGRRLSFFNSNTDTMMRASPGVSDRFQKPAGTEGGDCYLLLPDGGKVWFTMTVERWGDDFGPVTSTFDFAFNGIIDPHGQVTTVGYVANGSLQVTEPAGRWLQLFYITAPWNGDVLLDRVVASDGRSVKYNYGPYQPAGATTYSYLGNVQYLDRNGASYTQAIYWYQPGNVDPNGRPLISACIDPMYSGPMWAIAYNYAGSAVYGLFHREHYLNPANGQAGAPVTSVLSYSSGNSRTEIRGDGHERTFNYSGGKLVNYTDFKGQTSYISYDGNGFVGSVTDARGHTTTMIREGIIGALSQYKHHDQSYVGFAYLTVNGGPYHLQIRGDERGKNTYFTRDGNFRVTRIDYPDYPNGAYETFAYNTRGQVTSHRMTTGGMEYFYYDARGLMYASSSPAGTSYFYYDVHDRLAQAKNPRGHSTWYQYNARGQVTRVTHHDGNFIQIAYDNHGNRISVTDELNHTTTYGYDDYNRVVSVAQHGLPPATFNYAQDWANPYLHTTSSVKGSLSPMGKAVHYAYDGNWQRTITRQAPGTADDAWTFFDYDAAGNLTWTQDPRGYPTTFGYDTRNRRTSVTNALNETTSWQYDATSNLIRETRPDQSYRRLEYDSMNRVIDSYGFANERTRYIRNLAGHVTQMIDAKNASYGFAYDTLGRKTSATYPADATGYSRTENFWYDGASNLIQYKNPSGQYNYLAYDNRNRRTGSSWNYGGPAITTSYDAASRVTSLVTRSSPSGPMETTVAFGYDDANRQIWEEQTVAGSMRRIERGWNADGLPANLLVPAIGWVNLQYTYTQRNQIVRINDAYGNHWFKYDYDASGNMTKRQNIWAAINNATRVEYDQLNRPSIWEDSGGGDVVFARSRQQYDANSRHTATWRDEQASKGERFYYSPTNQLTNVRYNADQVWTGNPVNWDRWVDYGYTSDTLNRWYLNDNGNFAWYGANALNQYTSFGSLGLSYDGNFNLTGYDGASFTYNAAGQLTSASKNGNGAQFTYDGLGRCLKRTINGASTFFQYDGWKPILEYDGAGNLAAWNTYGAGPDEILYRWSTSGGETYYHSDQIGKVRFLLDGGGNGVEKYTYDAFGKPTITDANGNLRNESAYGNRFMFTGREYIKELGIYDYRFRHYQPELGRFLQKDPIGFAAGDANLFRYCGGDPVNSTDPSGLVTPNSRIGWQNNAIQGHTGQGLSTQGWWTNPSGTPTGVGPGSPGVPDGQGGGGGSWIDGQVYYPNTPGVVTVAAFPSIFVPDIFSQQFGPGQISTLGLNPTIAWRDVTSRFTDYYAGFSSPDRAAVDRTLFSDLTWSGITWTENIEVAPGLGVQLRLNANVETISFRFGLGPALGSGGAITTGVQSGQTVTGWNWQGSLSGGFRGWGGAISGNIWSGPQSTVNLGGGYGHGFGGTFVPGYTIVVPAPWAPSKGR